MLVSSILVFAFCQSGSFGLEGVRDFTTPPSYGRKLQFLSDLNGDGTPELFTSDYFSSTAGLTMNGKIEVISGASGVPLQTIGGPTDYSKLGRAILSISDLDGDGVQDYLASVDEACVIAYSGATFNTLYQTVNVWGMSAFISARPTLTEMEDIDGDQVPDFAYSNATANVQNNYGLLAVFSGATGSLIWSIQGSSGVTLRIGEATVEVSDVDLDGFKDLVVTASDDIICCSGASGAIIWTAPHPINTGWEMSLANIADVNNDGYSDVAHGDDVSNEIIVNSGVDGSLLYTVAPLSQDWLFGFSLLGVGDFNGDGAGDFLAGSPDTPYKGHRTGWVYLISGATGERLSSFPGLEEYKSFGWHDELLDAGDWNADGISEWAAVYHYWGGTAQDHVLIRVHKFIPPLSLQIVGTCPGTVTVNISGGTPNQLFGIAAGLGGAFLLPNGPVEDLELGTGVPIYSIIKRFDSNGNSQLTPTLPARACGMKIQVFDIRTRSTSAVLTL